MSNQHSNKDKDTTNNKQDSSNNSKATTTKDVAKTKEMSDGVFGLIVFAVLLTLVIWAVVSVTNTSVDTVTLGQLEYPASGKVGDSMTISYEPDQELAEGSSIEWYVDDVRIHSYSYDGEDVLSYQWQPTDTGRHTIQLRVGKDYTETATLTITRPIVVVNINDATMQYGDDMPQFSYDIDGLIGADTWQDIGCDAVVMCDNIDGVGIYTLSMSNTSCDSSMYELQFETGYLVVTPRQLTIANDISKVYDGTNSMLVGNIELEGIVEGDDVYCDMQQLYFEDKCVGQGKNVSTYNIELCGSDCDNYVIVGDAHGSISPRLVSIEGATVEGKVYDGNTSANINNMGWLVGVIDGDSVAIGDIQLHFDSAKVGKNKKIEIDNIALVGSDSDNYVVQLPEIQGKIVKKYIDLLVGNDVVEGNN